MNVKHLVSLDSELRLISYYIIVPMHIIISVIN